MPHWQFVALHWLQNSALGQLMTGSSWLYTAMLMLHFTGMAMLFGAMMLIDLRLLGLTKQVPLEAALSFVPVALIGFIINFVTGFCFFTFDPFSFSRNPAFQVKMILVLIAGLNALWFMLVEGRKLKVLAPYGDVDGAMKFSAGLSIGIWTLIIVCGRMIVGFQNLHI